MKRLLFIYNANAGKGRIRSKLSDIVEMFCRADYDVTIYATGAALEATKMVRERGSDFDVVVCSGGDGTINETISGIMSLEKRPVCGYIPMGTVNDFASSLHIPFDPIAAAKCITAGHIYKCDIGSFNDRSFNYIAGFGAFTEVSYETPQEMKNQFGRFAYFMDALRLLPDIRGFHMVVETEEKRFEGSYIFGMITNSKSVGGFALVKDYSQLTLDDGVFEVVLVKDPANPFEFEQTLVALGARDFNNKYLDVIQTERVRLTSSEPVKWTLDGESGGAQTEVEIVCNHHAVEIFSPLENSM